MNEYIAPLRDMRFILGNLAGLPAIAALPDCEEATPDLVAAILDEAGKFSAGVLAPLNQSGDREGCRLEQGSVITPAGWREAYAQFSQAGWVGLAMPKAYGGQALPKLVSTPVTEMWFAANLAFSILPPMALGAAEALMLAGSDAQKSVFLPKLASGEWAATMDLTEPNAGSDLGAIQTRAEPQPDGSYRLFGQKIFITYGEHELTENIMHLVLARIQGAPEGVRGISMFLVPKFLVNPDGSIGPRNDMQCISVEHKLGIHGSPTCTMSYGDANGAVGHLVGEPGRGLEYMFVMVNESRFNVGLQGIAIAERAYQKALAYSRERLQGRDAATGEQNVPIGRHPDVRRMLLVMRANVMATRMLAYVAAGWFDRARHDPDPEQAARCRNLVDLLMPVVKAWSTELGIETADIAIQIHGGTGYVEESGVAQYLRDVRITSIYEGTTGIQANDLISRKLLRDEGMAMRSLIAEIRGVAEQALGVENTAQLGAPLQQLTVILEQTMDWVVANGRNAKAEVLGTGVAFLRLTGLVCGGWQMTRAGLAAQSQLETGEGDAVYLRGIVDLAQFYFEHVAVQAASHARTVTQGGAIVARFADAAF